MSPTGERMYSRCQEALSLIWPIWENCFIKKKRVLREENIILFPADYRIDNTRWFTLGCQNAYVIGFAGTNPCGSSNGGCQYICLLSADASDGYTCACPDDLIQDSNGMDCLSKQVVHVHFHEHMAMLTAFVS